MAPSDNHMPQAALPSVFCWTKFGTEAGEATQSIFERKELERKRNGGIFLWGIGSSIRPSIAALLRETGNPEVIFSPMKSSASKKDTSPERLVLWSVAETYDGLEYKIPDHSLVTSRASVSNSRSAHFALVCESLDPISQTPDPKEALSVCLDELRNLRTGSILGASQVTSVVRRLDDDTSKESISLYPVAVRARLIYPYFVRLTGALPIPESLRLDRLENEVFLQAMDDLLERRRSAVKNDSAQQLMLV
ncbi:hypothetical protein ACWGJB_31285 [Streptomyces sp. NPDC054813]